jgi:hypothetical protein
MKPAQELCRWLGINKPSDFKAQLHLEEEHYASSQSAATFSRAVAAALSAASCTQLASLYDEFKRLMKSLVLNQLCCGDTRAVPVRVPLAASDIDGVGAMQCRRWGASSRYICIAWTNKRSLCRYRPLVSVLFFRHVGLLVHPLVHGNFWHTVALTLHGCSLAWRSNVA